MRSCGAFGLPGQSFVDFQAEGRHGHPGGGGHKLYLIGLGPGLEAGLTFGARSALDDSQVIIGYKLYVDQARPYLKEQKIVASGMTAEVARAEEAINLALAGQTVAVVSGGDAGVYAMAGAVFEVAAAKELNLGPGGLDIKVVPGIPAFVASAAILGAPLTHDFCAISLSDRLTPWPLIEKRLSLAAEADFVIALYNPKSHGRDWQLGQAAELISRRRPPRTPVGIVRKAMREGQAAQLITLAELPEAEVDMQTLVMIGNSSTFTYQGFMITPRGYVNKYGSKITLAS